MISPVGGAIFSFAGGSGMPLFWLLTVVLCIVLLLLTRKTENYQENMTS